MIVSFLALNWGDTGRPPPKHIAISGEVFAKVSEPAVRTRQAIEISSSAAIHPIRIDTVFRFIVTMNRS